MIYVLIYLLIGTVFNILIWNTVNRANFSVKSGSAEEFWTVILWPIWILIMIFLLKGDK